jgi:transcriptional regulator with XRE-family HTH domain
MHIGHKIKKIRDERKFSQAEMAEILGMSQSAYSRMERDETPVVMDDLVRYAKTLEVPINEFFPDFINVQNVHDQAKGGPNLIMGNFNYYHNSDEDTQKLLIQLLQKVLDKLGG